MSGLVPQLPLSKARLDRAISISGLPSVLYAVICCRAWTRWVYSLPTHTGIDDAGDTGVEPVTDGFGIRCSGLCANLLWRRWWESNPRRAGLQSATESFGVSALEGRAGIAPATTVWKTVVYLSTPTTRCALTGIRTLVSSLRGRSPDQTRRQEQVGMSKGKLTPRGVGLATLSLADVGLLSRVCA